MFYTTLNIIKTKVKSPFYSVLFLVLFREYRYFWEQENRYIKPFGEFVVYLNVFFFQK